MATGGRGRRAATGGTPGEGGQRMGTRQDGERGPLRPPAAPGAGWGAPGEGNVGLGGEGRAGVPHTPQLCPQKAAVPARSPASTHRVAQVAQAGQPLHRLGALWREGAGLGRANRGGHQPTGPPAPAWGSPPGGHGEGPAPWLLLAQAARRTVAEDPSWCSAPCPGMTPGLKVPLATPCPGLRARLATPCLLCALGSWGWHCPTVPHSALGCRRVPHGVSPPPGHPIPAPHRFGHGSFMGLNPSRVLQGAPPGGCRGSPAPGAPPPAPAGCRGSSLLPGTRRGKEEERRGPRSSEIAAAGACVGGAEHPALTAAQNNPDTVTRAPSPRCGHHPPQGQWAPRCLPRAHAALQGSPVPRRGADPVSCTLNPRGGAWAPPVPAVGWARRPAGWQQLLVASRVVPQEGAGCWGGHGAAPGAGAPHAVPPAHPRL